MTETNVADLAESAELTVQEQAWLEVNGAKTGACECTSCRVRQKIFASHLGLQARCKELELKNRALHDETWSLGTQLEEAGMRVRVDRAEHIELVKDRKEGEPLELGITRVVMPDNPTPGEVRKLSALLITALEDAESHVHSKHNAMRMLRDQKRELIEIVERRGALLVRVAIEASFVNQALFAEIAAEVGLAEKGG